MRRWNWGFIIPCCLSLAVWILLLFMLSPAKAHGATGQELADQTADWIGQTVGAPSRRLVLDPGPALGENADGLLIVGQVTSDKPGVATIYPEFLGSWHRAANGKTGPLTADAAATVLHELVHRAPIDWNFDPYLEEGITEAITEDLLPAWSVRFLGERIEPWQYEHSYPKEVAYIRHQSALATGAGWRTRAARLWRRAFYLADRSTRLAMIPTRGGS